VVATAAAAVVAAAGTAAANAPRGPERDATLDGTNTNRNAGPVNAPARQTMHSSPDADTASTANLTRPRLGAGPRTPPARQLRWQRSPSARDACADNADFAPGGVPALAAWHANAGWPATDANAALPPGRPRCNNGSADAMADRLVRIPSADSVAAGNAIGPVESDPPRTDTELGPREQPTPWVKSRRRAGRSPPRRSYWHIGVQHSERGDGLPRRAWLPSNRCTEWRPRPARHCAVIAL
jgi:hypothetical protein